MLSIELYFPTGRYHATPWDQHVNEGAVEWPPSPWRLLRALVATWHLKARHEIDETGLADLLEVLAKEAPCYDLPVATGTHTRHYMPIGSLNKGMEKTTKIFDTFVHVGAQAPVAVTWPEAILDETQAETLRLLLSRMGYFGRAESWVEALLAANEESVAGAAASTDGSIGAHPLEPDGMPGPEQELIRVLCPLTSREIAAWHALTFERERERRLAEKRREAEAKGKDPTTVKLGKSEQDKLSAALPHDLMDALEADTGELHKQGWSAVPGTRWVDYVRPRDAITHLPRSPAAPVERELPNVARFAIASQVPPRLTECLSFSDRVRAALLSRSDGAPIFSGKDESGHPLQGNRHAFILPESNGRHGRITQVTIFAAMGFDETARRAMDTLRNVWGHDERGVQLVLLGVGSAEDFAGTNTAAGQCPLFVESDTWVSRTPFVPTRYPKAKRSGEPKLDELGLQIGSPEHDLRRLLRAANLPEPTSVARVDSTELGGKRLRWVEFKILRHRGEGARSANRGFGFRVVFPEAVRGPIAVGYGAHFGLGSFEPVVL